MRGKGFSSHPLSHLLKALALCILAQFVTAQTYNIVDLGGLSGSNNSEGESVSRCGHVAGYGYTAPGPHGFFWSEHDGMRDLGTLPEGDWSVAMGINASGDVAGYADYHNGYGRHAVLWRDGRIHDLGTLPGGLASEAHGMNDRGEIVGYSDSGSGASDAILWDRHGRMHDLGVLPGGSYGQAIAVNQHHEVVGYSQNHSGTARAFSWTKRAGMEDLGTLPGGATASAGGINNLGQIVGGSDTWIQGHYYCCRAVLWSKDKKTEDLGMLPGASGSGAGAINDHGEVVGSSGWTAFIWSRENGMQDLNDLIPGNSGWGLEYATSINDRGQITGWGTINSEFHAFLLTPVSQPLWGCN